MGHRGVDTLATELDKSILPHESQDWIKGSVEDWAWESYQIAVADVYDLLPTHIDKPISLPDGYEDRAKTVLALQLKKGGIRLAFLVNKALGVE